MAEPRELLIFRLWGPMASWGSIAVGEQRQTWTRPSRSAVLGLVAAALGIERGDALAHSVLEQGLALAVRDDTTGRHLRDYHTTQTPSSEAKRRWRSRRDELLGAKKLNTILSDRDYLIEASAVVVLWQRPGSAAPAIGTIAERLRFPLFTLYLGRKASPLGLPLRPRVIAASSLAGALHEFDKSEAHGTIASSSPPEWPDTAGKARLGFQRWLIPQPPPPGQPAHLWIDPRDLAGIGATAAAIPERTQRRDGIRDRRTWTFDERAEVRVRLENLT